MKVAIYCRVSTQDQNLEQQVESCVKECSHRWKVFEYFVFQEKISGTKESRPQLDAMLRKVRMGEINAVMVWKLDRLGRSTLHLIQLIEEFKNKGVQFIALTQNIDTATPQGKFFLTIMAGFAELERELIKERTKARIDRLKAEGKTLGRPKGSRDKKDRRKSGYLLRWAGKKPTPHKMQEIQAQEATNK